MFVDTDWELEDWLLDAGEHAERKRIAQGAALLTPVERLIREVWLLDMEIRNGGLAQYFLNRGPGQWQTLREAWLPAEVPGLGPIITEIDRVIAGAEIPHVAAFEASPGIEERYEFLQEQVKLELRQLAFAAGLTAHLVLLIPDKDDVERDSLAAVWEKGGGTVLRLGRFWDPPTLVRERVRVYGSDSFCLVLQQKLDLSLVSPPDDHLVRIPPDLLGRKVFLTSLADVHQEQFPAFVKPVTPKLFRAAVYESAAAVQQEAFGLEDHTQLMVSEVITFFAEARAFVLDGAVLDCAVYEGSASSEAARAFAEQVSARAQLPRAVVIDVGLTATGWAVVEFNAAWGAGLNGCSAAAVLPCVAAASAPDGPPFK